MVELCAGSSAAGGLRAVLAALPAAEGASALRLSLLPLAVVHNCTLVPVSIVVRSNPRAADDVFVNV